MGVAERNSPSSLANLCWSWCSQPPALLRGARAPARFSCKKGPPAGCKLYDELEQTRAKTCAFCHRQTQPLQGLHKGKGEKAARSAVASKICGSGSERGSDPGVALPTLITQTLYLISSAPQLLQQHRVLPAVLGHRSLERALMKRYFIQHRVPSLLLTAETAWCVSSQRTSGVFPFSSFSCLSGRRLLSR